MQENSQALPVPKSLPTEDQKRLDAGGMPQTAMEFMYLVTKEAKSYPSISVAANTCISKPKPNKQETVIPKEEALSNELEPNEDWINIMLENFDMLRSSIMEKLKLKKQIHKQFTFPSKSNEKGWHTFCFPNLPFDDVEEDTNTENKESIEQSNGDEDSSDEESEVYEATTNEVTESTYPQLTPLIFMDHMRVVRLFTYQVEWLCINEEPLCEERCLWLYALLARLEEPFTPEIYGDIHCLYQYCVKQRNSMSPDSLLLPHINILLYITGVYFKQGF